LITGGTKGIGAATAVELARLGADIALNGRVSDAEAMAVKAKVEGIGRRGLLVIADLAKPTEAARCVATTASTLGGVDVLIHSAGGFAPGSLLEVSPEVWHQAFDIHVHATGAQGCLRRTAAGGELGSGALGARECRVQGCRHRSHAAGICACLEC
jgi:NAD(P)-dependent dehydrogenase (short-subunit alcohol dehydrogenase family)